MKIRITILFIIISLFPISLFGRQGLELVNSQTAYTLDRGIYNAGMYLYDDGGIHFRALIGINEKIIVGISESVDNMVGKDNIKFNIPAVMAKFRFIGEMETDFNVAVGFGPHTFSTIGYRHDSQVQGFYAVLSKGSPLIQMLPLQFFHAGIKYPILPDLYQKENVFTFFTGVNLSIVDEVELKVEVENITYNGVENPNVNVGVVYHFSEMLSFELDFQYTENELDKPEFYRMFKISYNNIFY